MFSNVPFWTPANTHLEGGNTTTNLFGRLIIPRKRGFFVLILSKKRAGFLRPQSYMTPRGSKPQMGCHMRGVVVRVSSGHRGRGAKRTSTLSKAKKTRPLADMASLHQKKQVMKAGNGIFGTFFRLKMPPLTIGPPFLWAGVWPRWTGGGGGGK